MRNRILLCTLLLLAVISSCRKDKTEDGPDGETHITTLALTDVPATSVYGSDLTLKVSFEALGAGDKAVDKYGIVYKAWIQDISDKTPAYGSSTAVFFNSVPEKDKVIIYNITLSFQDFNDANYRAFAVLKDGTVVYGDIMYFLKA